MDTSKETIQPNNEAPRARGTNFSVPLFHYFVMTVPAERPLRPRNERGGEGDYLTKFYQGRSDPKFPRSNPFPSIDKLVPLLLCILVHGGREYCMTPARAAAKETISIAT